MSSETFEVICTTDPAIDSESMTAAEMYRYAEKRDPKLLRFKPGMQPTRFLCREVPDQLWESFVMATDIDAERDRRAFLASVVSVTNLRQRNGAILGNEGQAWTYGDGRMSATAFMPAADAERFMKPVRAEVGCVTRYRSFLVPGIEPTYPLPPMLAQLLDGRVYRRADASPTSPVPSSSEASQAGPQPLPGTTPSTTPTGADSSGSRTAATATTPPEGATAGA